MAPMLKREIFAAARIPPTEKDKDVNSRDKAGLGICSLSGSIFIRITTGCWQQGSKVYTYAKN